MSKMGRWLDDIPVEMALAMGRRLRHAREEACIGKLAFSKRAHICANTLAAVENGTALGLPAYRLLRIAQALGVTCDWLLTGREEGDAEAPEAGEGEVAA